MAKNPIAALVVVALALAGCSKAVQITAPTSSPLTAPLTAFTVKFSPFFAPGSFTAQLDGTDVTPKFVPVAAPGGTSTMKLPDTCSEGLTGGTQVGGGSQGRSNPPGATSSGTSSGPPTSGSAPSTGGGSVGSGSGTGPATPNITFSSHQLHVSGLCNGLICATTDDFAFFPLHLVANPTTLDVRIGRTVPATVETFPASSTSIPVCVRPIFPSVSLDGRPPGTPIMRTIPAGGGASAPFTITGVVSSNLLLFVEAAGVQTGSIQGTVNP